MHVTRLVGAALCAAMLSLPACSAPTDDAHVLLIQAVAAWDDSGDMRDALPFLERAFEAAPEDPLVLLHLDKFCRGPAGDIPLCTDNNWPRRIAEVDPENGAPWLELAARAARAKDWDAVRGALAEAADRGRYDGYFGRHVSALYFADRKRNNLQTWLAATGIAAAAHNYEAGIIDACRETDGDARTLDLCHRVAGQMLDHARSRVGALIAASVLEQNPAVTADERAKIAALKDRYNRTSRTLVEIEPRLRADPSMIEDLARSLGQHGERQTWRRLTGE